MPETPLTGNEDHDIDLSTASDWTANYRATVPTTAILGNYFGKTAVQELLDQEGAIGIRIYYAIDGDGEKRLILVGVDGDGDDLYEGALAELARTNPPYGVTANPLNS
jgi:hypothetical protein